MGNDIVYEDAVTGSDCGWALTLSPVSAFQRVQNAMCIYMGALGLDGIQIVQKYHATWIITRNKIDFLKPLKWNDSFCAKCRLIGKSAARCVLNIGLFNAADELCVSAHMEMCALDLETKRIVKLSSIGFDIVQPQTEFYESGFTRIRLDKLESIAVRQIALSSIDYNQHTNNVEYMRLILDTYTLDDFRERQIQSVQIDYVNQSRLGDELTVSKGKCGSKDTIVIQHSEGVIARSQIEWSDSPENEHNG